MIQSSGKQYWGHRNIVGNFKYQEHFSNVYFTECRTLNRWCEIIYTYPLNSSYIIENTSSNSDKQKKQNIIGSI